MVVTVDVQARGAVEHPFAPARDEIALAIQHHHRVGAAIEHIEAVLAVDRDGSDVGEAPAVRQLREVFDDAVAMVARAENGRHVYFPLKFLCRHSGMVRRTRPGISRFPDALCASWFSLRGPRNDNRWIYPSSARGPTPRGKNPSSIALICNARWFEPMRHWARAPAIRP